MRPRRSSPHNISSFIYLLLGQLGRCPANCIYFPSLWSCPCISVSLSASLMWCTARRPLPQSRRMPRTCTATTMWMMISRCKCQVARATPRSPTVSDSFELWLPQCRRVTPDACLVIPSTWHLLSLPCRSWTWTRWMSKTSSSFEIGTCD